MAGMWPADRSKRDISLAVCRDKLDNNNDGATGGQEGAVEIHLILKAHTWQAIPPPPSSHLSACHATRRSLAGDSKSFRFPFWHHREVRQAFL